MTIEVPLTLPELRGDHVRLRAFSERDLPTILDAALDPMIPLLTTVPSDPDTVLAAAFLERQHARVTTGQGYSFAIATQDDVAVGQIGLWLQDLDQGRASIGYWIAPATRRRGHALDALRTLVAWAEQLPGIDRLELHVEPWNEGSWRTAERAGFTREGLLRSWQHVGTERKNMYVYSRIVHDRGDAASLGRVVLLGDSHFARLDRNQLEQLRGLGGTNALIVNHATSGSTVVDLAAEVDQEILLPSDRVAISIGTNDCAPWKQTPLPRFYRELDRLLHRLQDYWPVLLAPPRIDEQLQDAHGRTRLRHQHDRTPYVEAIRTIAEQRHLALVDIPAGPVNDADGVHLNERGTQELIEGLAHALSSVGQHPPLRTTSQLQP